MLRHPSNHHVPRREHVTLNGGGSKELPAQLRQLLIKHLTQLAGNRPGRAAQLNRQLLIRQPTRLAGHRSKPYCVTILVCMSLVQAIVTFANVSMYHVLRQTVLV